MVRILVSSRHSRPICLSIHFPAIFICSCCLLLLLTLRFALLRIHSTPRCIHSTPRCIHSTPRCIHSMPRCIHSTPRCIHSTSTSPLHLHPNTSLIPLADSNTAYLSPHSHLLTPSSLCQCSLASFGITSHPAARFDVGASVAAASASVRYVFLFLGSYATFL